MTGATLTPHTPVHPGRILRREIEARELSPTAAAKELGFTVAKLKGILAGDVHLTEADALQIADTWGQNPQTWLNLQQQHDTHPKVHGGKRKGAGRPKTGLVTKQLRVSGTPDQLAAIEAWMAAQGKGNGARAAGRALFEIANEQVQVH